uniref:Uncharacterized protein n=1 Tax=Candidatus Kentrum sp. UNK TaxID=2126344 RepID=A0A451ANY7_9GAMM|nr:MAG: hypothetical protein BECKUNK1418G_GA0071005_11634 [Candidatus Kentron sp. UNK]
MECIAASNLLSSFVAYNKFMNECDLVSFLVMYLETYLITSHRSVIKLKSSFALHYDKAGGKCGTIDPSLVL